MTAGAGRGDTLVIGVAGHRPHALDGLDDARIRDQVHDVLLLLSRLNPHASLISPIAEGADRLVAREALELGMPLTCLLPFERDLYRKDFTSRESIDEYEDLLRRAQCVRELPGVHGTSAERDTAYVAVSDAMLDQIELLIALWDGNESRGIGGTADTVHAALARGIPVIWIQADPPHDTCLLGLVPQGGIKTEPLGRLPQRLQR